jgi:hypothetical protein
MDRMTDSGSVGWAFESPRDHQLEIILINACRDAQVGRLYVYRNLIFHVYRGDENCATALSNRVPRQRDELVSRLWARLWVANSRPGITTMENKFFYKCRDAQLGRLYFVIPICSNPDMLLLSSLRHSKRSTRLKMKLNQG